MLDPAKVDLASLAEALEDQSDELSRWWLDPATGEVDIYLEDDGYFDPDPRGDPEERGLVPIEPVSSSEAYADMEDFIARVRDGRARDLLSRAIQGRGAFRRFKDTLFEFPELREAWFRFHDARARRRALDWLADEGLVEIDAVARERERLADPDLPELESGFDADEVAAAVARDLRDLYGDRFVDVVLFGSRARGDAHPESDLDLLVVLDDMESPWDEIERMSPLLWDRTLEHGVMISGMPFTRDDWEACATPMLLAARAEGRSVA